MPHRVLQHRKPRKKPVRVKFADLEEKQKELNKLAILMQKHILSLKAHNPGKSSVLVHGQSTLDVGIKNVTSGISSLGYDVELAEHAEVLKELENRRKARSKKTKRKK